VRIEYDAARGLVNLMIGNECVDQMALQVYAEAFGVDAALEISRPEFRRYSSDVLDPRD
jgi:hypothetical protein